jgi:hypothetical protein
VSCAAATTSSTAKPLVPFPSHTSGSNPLHSYPTLAGDGTQRISTSAVQQIMGLGPVGKWVSIKFVLSNSSVAIYRHTYVIMASVKVLLPFHGPPPPLPFSTHSSSSPPTQNTVRSSLSTAPVRPLPASRGVGQTDSVRRTKIKTPNPLLQSSWLLLDYFVQPRFTTKPAVQVTTAIAAAPFRPSRAYPR